MCLNVAVKLTSVVLFLPADTTATIFFAARFLWLLFKGSYYLRAVFISADINDGWISYI